VLRDSLRIARPRGRVCQLGFLGGLAPVPGFDPIADLPTGVQLSFYGSAFVLGSEDFPLAEPVRVFGFGQIVEAHRVMEEGTVAGKMVVALS
jgi:NADPH:quinone reductase